MTVLELVAVLIIFNFMKIKELNQKIFHNASQIKK